MPAKVSRSEVLIGFLAVLSIFLVVLGNMMISKGRFPVGVYVVDLVICGVFGLGLREAFRSSERRAVLVEELVRTARDGSCHRT